MTPALRSLAIVLGALCADTATAGDKVQHIPVTDAAMLATPEARQQLRYLASCALDAGTILTGINEGQSFSFPGGMGLAPGWADRPMSVSERRWVSACILGRMNASGLPVQISMRGNAPFRSLNASTVEAAQFPIHKAGFFGDTFSDEPRAYVCLNLNVDDRQARQAQQNRLCAHDDGSGNQTTQCGLRIVGPCPSVGEVHFMEETWSEIIHVYLPETYWPEKQPRRTVRPFFWAKATSKRGHWGSALLSSRTQGSLALPDRRND